MSFWIDTLFVTVDSQSTRNTAIRLMRKTYEEADKVLVLDSFLRSQSTAVYEPHELLSMIDCCRWKTRLWSLQERLLARNRLFIEFSDTILNYHLLLPFCRTLDLARRFCNYHYLADFSRGTLLEEGKRHVFQYMLSAYPDIDSGVEYQEVHIIKASRLSLVLRLFRGRATSKATDEALCSGSLLNLNMRHLLSVPADRRMEMLWRLLPAVPPAVVFLNVPKLKTKGFRWAAQSFRTTKGMVELASLPGEADAIKTTRGLQVRFPGWWLGCPHGRELSLPFYFLDPGSRMFLVGLPPESSEQDWQPNKNPWTLEAKWPDTAALCPISRYDLNNTDGDQSSMRSEVILAIAYPVDQSVYYARIVSPVVVFKVDPAGARLARAQRQDMEPMQAGSFGSDTDRNPASGLRYARLGLTKLTESSARRDLVWCID